MAERVERNSGRVPKESAGAVEKESDLHRDIQRYCEERGWIALHGSMAHRAMRTVGEWDFVILADCARTFLIECKAKGRKPTVEQTQLHFQARRMGHYSAIVWSMADFLEVVK